MVLQEVPLQVNAATVEVSSAFVPEAALPAFDFASAFSGSSAGFAPTSILIELFGAFAFPGTSDPIASALLLGLSGHRPGQLTPTAAASLLSGIVSTKTLHLNGSIAIPFLAAEHLVLNPTGLSPAHPDGIRLTAYHCVHALVTRQYYATPADPLSFTEC